MMGPACFALLSFPPRHGISDSKHSRRAGKEEFQKQNQNGMQQGIPPHTSSTQVLRASGEESFRGGEEIPRSLKGRGVSCLAASMWALLVLGSPFFGGPFSGPGGHPNPHHQTPGSWFQTLCFCWFGTLDFGGGEFVGTRHVCKTRTKENEPYRSTVLYVRLGREQKKVEEGRGVDKDVKVHN